MTDIPDLTSYYMIHDAMRRASSQLAGALAGLPSDSTRFDADRLDALRWYTHGFVRELHDHHRTEDEVFFPALAARVPTFADHGPGLGADHGRLDVVMNTLTSAVSRLADGREWHTSLALAVDASAQLARLLDDHLATEDDDVLPLFVRHFDAAEYHALDRRAIERIGLRQLLFTVPWAVTTAEPAAASHRLATAPAVVRGIWRLTRNRHVRLASLALGTDISVVTR